MVAAAIAASASSRPQVRRPLSHRRRAILVRGSDSYSATVAAIAALRESARAHRDLRGAVAGARHAPRRPSRSAPSTTTGSSAGASEQRPAGPRRPSAIRVAGQLRGPRARGRHGEDRAHAGAHGLGRKGSAQPGPSVTRRRRRRRRRAARRRRCRGRRRRAGRRSARRRRDPVLVRRRASARVPDPSAVTRSSSAASTSMPSTPRRRDVAARAPSRRRRRPPAGPRPRPRTRPCARGLAAGPARRIS